MRRENNKIVEEGIKKLRREIKLKKCKKKKGWLAFFDYFYRFLSNHCAFDSFCFKRYLVSDFIASNYQSRVLIDPC